MENVKSGLIAMALDLPKVSSHSDLGSGPSLEEIAPSSGKRAENNRLAGQQADAEQSTRGSCSTGLGFRRPGPSAVPLSKGRAHF